MACVLVLYGCPERPSEKGEVLAEVYGEKLYLDEAKASIPASMFDKDSAAVITKFVNDWILNQVLYRHASKIIDQKALDKEIENYRLSLTIARFEALWLEENLNTSITQDEVQRYYLGNTGQFILEEDALRCLFIKVLDTADIVKRIDPIWKKDARDSLAMFCTQNAGHCLVNEDQWFTESEYKLYVPPAVFDQRRSGRTSFSESHNGFKYYVKILEKAQKDNPSPVQLVQDKIKQRILHNRSRNLLRDMKEELFKRNIQNKEIKVYTNS